MTERKVPAADGDNINNNVFWENLDSHAQAFFIQHVFGQALPRGRHRSRQLQWQTLTGQEVLDKCWAVCGIDVSYERQHVAREQHGRGIRLWTRGADKLCHQIMRALMASKCPDLLENEQDVDATRSFVEVLKQHTDNLVRRPDQRRVAAHKLSPVQFCTLFPDGRVELRASSLDDLVGWIRADMRGAPLQLTEPQLDALYRSVQVTDCKRRWPPSASAFVQSERQADQERATQEFLAQEALDNLETCTRLINLDELPDLLGVSLSSAVSILGDSADVAHAGTFIGQFAEFLRAHRSKEHKDHQQAATAIKEYCFALVNPDIGEERVGLAGVSCALRVAVDHDTKEALVTWMMVEENAVLPVAGTIRDSCCKAVSFAGWRLLQRVRQFCFATLQGIKSLSTVLDVPCWKDDQEGTSLTDLFLDMGAFSETTFVSSALRAFIVPRGHGEAEIRVWSTIPCKQAVHLPRMSFYEMKRSDNDPPFWHCVDAQTGALRRILPSSEESPLECKGWVPQLTMSPLFRASAERVWYWHVGLTHAIWSCLDDGVAFRAVCVRVEIATLSAVEKQWLKVNGFQNDEAKGEVATLVSMTCSLSTKQTSRLVAPNDLPTARLEASQRLTRSMTSRKRKDMADDHVNDDQIINSRPLKKRRLRR